MKSRFNPEPNTIFDFKNSFIAINNKNNVEIIKTAFCFQASINPFIFCFTVQITNKYYKMLLTKNSFNINLCYNNDIKPDISLFFNGRFKKEPIYKPSKLCIECEIISQIKIGNAILFAGEAKYFWK